MDVNVSATPPLMATFNNLLKGQPYIARVVGVNDAGNGNFTGYQDAATLVDRKSSVYVAVSNIIGFFLQGKSLKLATLKCCARLNFTRM